MKNTLKELLSTSLYLLVVVVLCFLVIKFVGQRSLVIGSSMETTLSDNDNLILDKISYRFHDPERFDVIVFPFRNGEKKTYIKRIIGLPGETIQIDFDGNIFIDGEILQESYGREVINNPGLAYEPITLGDDEYFVMGDNRNHSEDSRFSEVGKVSRSEILGRAWLRVFPIHKWGLVKKIGTK